MRWLRDRKQKRPEVSVSIGEKYFAAVGRCGESYLFFEFVQIEQNREQALSFFLKYLSDTYKLINATARLVFEHSQYQLLMTDALDVERSELANALKWQVKDLLEHRVDDVLLDAFLVPKHGNANHLKKAFVAACCLSDVQKIQKIFKQHFFLLSEVNIALFSERNLLQLLPSHDETDIMVSFCENYCYISLIQQGNVYFVRKIINQNTASLLEFDEEGRSELLTELQRSIDYCRSHLKLPEVRRIVFPYLFSEHIETISVFKRLLSQEVILLDVTEHWSLGKELSSNNQLHCWYALGALCDVKIDEARVLDAAS